MARNAASWSDSVFGRSRFVSTSQLHRANVERDGSATAATSAGTQLRQQNGKSGPCWHSRGATRNTSASSAAARSRAGSLGWAPCFVTTAATGVEATRNSSASSAAARSRTGSLGWAPFFVTTAVTGVEATNRASTPPLFARGRSTGGPADVSGQNAEGATSRPNPRRLRKFALAAECSRPGTS